MLVVPRRNDVRLVYAGRTWADWLGLGLFVATVTGGVVGWRRRKPRGSDAPGGAAGIEVATRAAWSGRILRSGPPLALLALAATRLLPAPAPPITVDELDARASRAFSAGRWEDAAEYARHAVERLGSARPHREEMLCVRGEALLRAGHPREAARDFEAVITEAPADPHRGQALYSGARAREEAGDAVGAAEWRRLLRQEVPVSPWTERLAADEAAPPREGP